jgi:hypothetical protein
MTAPASLEDFPHIAQAHKRRRIRIAPQKDAGVITRTIVLSAFALIAPVIAGTVVGMATRDGGADAPPHVQERPFALAVTSAPAASTIR